jgi:hypothetical protein
LTTVSYIVLLIILLIAPRGETTLTDVEAEIGTYDDTVTYRSLIVASMVLGAVTGGGELRGVPPVPAGVREAHRLRHGRAGARDGVQEAGIFNVLRERRAGAGARRM